MAGEWLETTLGEFVRLQRGHDLPEADRRPGVVPIMGSAGHNGFHDTAIAKGPGVVIGRSWVGSMGVVTYCATEYWPHNTVLYVTDFLGNDERFTYYFLGHMNLRRFDSGSAQASLNRNYIYPIGIRVPGPAEQRAIAHIFGTLDDKIELNRRMNETLEAMARALFKSWFVAFDPVRAKAEGRDPGLPEEIADLFPDSFEDSELGEIPVGWSTGTILEQATLLSGGTPKTDRAEYWDGGIPWASAKDVSQCGQAFLIATERAISPKGLEESATQLIPALSTVVVARGATTGRMVLLGRDMAMNQTCYALKSTTATPFALHCRLRQEIDGLVHAAHGSVFDTITTRTFSASKVVVAVPLVLRAFEQQISPVFQRILKSTEESHTLAALRDMLLPRLISGELRVKDAERFVDGVDRIDSMDEVDGGGA